ncbi:MULTISPECIES: CopG family transcriptional regulator [Cysteiniphilum]|uniref:CopG family transcriptional regulator n=1 Tax=Cysteiniphilum TaxID=2056696 RepID=UPI00177B0854|nr:MULTISPECIES: CopG family transcriptional regulator [Cysteiniphilum]
MSSARLSISIPATQFEFIKSYAKTSHKDKSKIIQEALNLLQQQQLEQAYKMANKEIDSSFDVTINDGLSDETW